MTPLNALGFGVTAFIAVFLVLDYLVYPIVNKKGLHRKAQDIELGIVTVSGMIGLLTFLFAL